jgi:Spy/CpxP family protein refolding chaperone
MSILLALALSTLPQAAAGDRGRMAEIADELELTGAQRLAVEDIVYKSQLARVDLKARLKRGEMELKHLLGQPTLDEKAVRAATDAVVATTGEVIRNRVDRILAIRKQLTAEQWEELKGIWQEDREEEEEDE